MIKIFAPMPFDHIITNEPICKCGCNCSGYSSDVGSVYEAGTFSDGEG